MKNNNEIKVYDIVVDMNDNKDGMIRNSFVDAPAVLYTKLNFSKQEKNIINFSEELATEQKFMSVSMVANTPIPRIDENTGEEFAINFSKEAIRTIVNKFIMDGNIHEVSFQHTNELIKGVYLVEHFITKNGIMEAPAFKELPEGSWVTVYYVPDLELYNRLKNDKTFNGFSIEIGGSLEEQFNEMRINKLYNEFEEILNSSESDDLKEYKIKQLLGIK